MEQGKINEHLVDKMFSKMGLVRTGGKKNNAGPLLPLLFMDAQYMLFCEKIRNHDFKEIKDRKLRAWILYHRSKWNGAYNDFNKSLMKSWNVEERDYIGDMMNSFEDYINNELVILKVSTMNLLGHMPIEEQDILATVVVCNSLIKYAQVTWGNVFRDKTGKKTENKKIAEAGENAKKLESYYYRGSEDFNLNDDELFNRSIDSLAMKAIKWMKEYV